MNYIETEEEGETRRAKMERNIEDKKIDVRRATVARAYRPPGVLMRRTRANVG